jgi:hypothetical protein
MVNPAQDINAKDSIERSYKNFNQNNLVTFQGSRFPTDESSFHWIQRSEIFLSNEPKGETILQQIKKV